MKSPQRVVWTEGMFMAPQHMQQLDRYHEVLVASRVGAIVPYDWGVVNVQIDPRALSAGQLKVVKFAGVLPDGLPLAFDESHPETPAARPVEGFFPANQRTLEVYLGVAHERDGVANYSNTNPTAGMRFVVAPKPTYDTTTGSSEIQVALAQRNVTIMFGTEPRDNVEAIKIAEVVREASGAMVLRNEFIPSIRRISASPYMISRIKTILEIMVAKSRQLGEGRRQRDGATVEFGAGDVTRFLLLNAVNTFIPVLSYMADNGEMSPENCFFLCSQFAGQLCAFAVDADPSTLPKFVYTDLTTTFVELFNRIEALLKLTIKERYIQVPLEARTDGLHWGQLADERLPRTLTYILSVRTDLPERQVIDQLPQLSKVASWNDLQNIIHSALPGVPLRVTHNPPPEIPVRAGMLYFALDTSNQYWNNVRNERTISIYLPPPYDPSAVKIELLAVPPAEAGR